MGALRRVLVIVTVVGLLIDAYVHLHLAGGYDTVGTTITEGMLFRIEAGLALISGALLLVLPNRVTAALAALVAGGGTFALLLYYFVNVGDIGPIPNMHENVLYGEKSITLVAQAIATITAIVLVVIGFPTREPAPAAAEGRMVNRVP